MQQKTESAEKEDVSDVDELQRKAEQLREDGMFNVRIKNWEKSNSNEVDVVFEKPDGGEEHNTMDWPDKPTKDNKFIRICMDALDLQSAKDAAMMAENLKNCGLDNYKVKADVDGGEWEVKPEVDLGTKEKIYSRLQRDGEDNANVQVDWSKKLFSMLLGPIALLYLSVVGTFFEPKYWFCEDKSSEESYWVIVCVLYSVVGSIIWLPLLLFLV